VLTVIARSFTSTREAALRVEERSELEQMGRIALDIFVREMQAAYIDTPVGSSDIFQSSRYVFIGTDQSSGSESRDSLVFVTFSPKGILSGGLPTGLAEIELSLSIPMGEEVGFLMHREDAIPDDDFAEGGISFDLAERVRSLNFRFLSENGEWEDSWDSRNKTPPLPVAVEMTISFDGLRGEHTSVSTIAKVELGSS